jgi:hypothetical protein
MMRRCAMPRCGMGARRPRAHCVFAAQSAGGCPAPWHVACCGADMVKTSFIVLTVITACATSGKPVVPGGGETSANAPSEAAENVTFAVSRDGTRIAFEKVGNGLALVIVGGALSQRDGGNHSPAR